MTRLLPCHAGAPERMATRKAALVLHALGAQDRHWVMQRLPELQRDLVQPLLEELAQLGLPADKGLVDDVLGSMPTPHRMDLPVASALEQVSAHKVALLLQDEPDALVGKLLSLQAWPWKDHFISLLPRERRAAVLQSLASYTRDSGAGIVAPELDAALLQELEARLKDLLQEPIPTRRLMSRWRSTAAWLRAARRHRLEGRMQ